MLAQPLHGRVHRHRNAMHHDPGRLLLAEHSIEELAHGPADALAHWLTRLLRIK